MKYHIRLRHIVTSLVLLIFCSTVVLFLYHDERLPQLFPIRQTPLELTLGSDNAYQIDIGSIGRTFFSNLKLFDLRITAEESTVPFAHIGTLASKASLVRLLIPYLWPEVIELSLDNWQITSPFPLDGTSTDSFTLPRPLAVAATEGRVMLNVEQGALDVTIDNLNTALSETLDITSLSVEVSYLAFEHPDVHATLEDLHLSYQDSVRNALRISGAVGPLVMRTIDPRVTVLSESIHLLFEAHSLAALLDGAFSGQLNIGQIKGTLAEDLFELDAIELAVVGETWQTIQSSVLGRSMSIEVLEAQLEPVNLYIPTFNSYFSYQDETVDGFINTERAKLDYGTLNAELQEALLTLALNPEHHTYTLSVGRGALFNPIVDLHDSYLSVTSEPDYQQLHGQFSTHLYSLVQTDRFSGELFGQYFIDLPILASEVSFASRAFETSLVEGTQQVHGSLRITESQVDQFEIDIEHDGGLSLHAEYQGAEDEIGGYLQFDDLYLHAFRQLLERIELLPQQVIKSDTSLGGTISGSVKRNWSRGELNAQLGFAKLYAGERPLNFATTFSGSLDEEAIHVDKLTLTLQDLRLEYRGVINRALSLPEGQLSIQNPQTGEVFAHTDFFELDRRTYGFHTEIPLLKSTTLRGDLTFDFDAGITSQATFTLFDHAYEFNLHFQFQPLTLSILGNQFSLSMALSGEATNQLEGLLSFDGLTLPPFDTSFVSGQGELSGTLSIAYQVGEEVFHLQSERLSLKNLSWPSDNRWQVDSSLTLDGKQIALEAFTYQDQSGAFDGRLILHTDSLFTLLQSGSGARQLIVDLHSPEESIEASLYSSNDNREALEGLIRLQNLSLQRFMPLTDDLFLTLAVLGSINVPAGYIDATATVELSSEHENAPILISEITLEPEKLSLDLLEGNFGSFSFSNTSLEIPKSGAISLATELIFTRESVWQPGVFHYSFSGQSHHRSYSNLFASLGALTGLAKEDGSLELSVTGLKQLGESASDQLDITLTYQQPRLSIRGKAPHEVRGEYDFSNQQLELYVPPSLPVALRAQGTLDANTISLGLSELKIPITYLNQIFAVPIFYFVSGTIYGDLFIEGALADPYYFGTLYSDKVDGRIFFTPDQLISLKNPVISISQNTANVGYTSLVGTNKEGKKTRGYLGIEFALEKWNMPSIDLAFLIPDEPMHLWVPLPPSSINIDAMIKGDFVIAIDQNETMISGDVIFDSGALTFEIPPVPAWYQEPMATSLDLMITTGKNVHFAFPSSKTPIIQALFNDNQKVYLGYDYGANVLSFEGKPSFRSGEIYYVQKNFYITEGALAFGRTLAGSSDINAIIDLRARIREFDSSGNKVDIYLVLDNSPIDNLNPRFESLPLMGNNEILEMLGQGVLGKTTYRESGFSSVIALATAATDMISRLGIIDASVDTSFGLTPLLRQSLNLDVLTIRSNLLQNILIDAIPGQSEAIALSPMAKYLDNTTLYLGKYLLDDLYLQGMISLRAAGPRPTVSSTFLANDIDIDTELSLEWTTPLATFTLFTRPNELSVLNLLDRIGFSVTKRIAF